LKMWQTESKTKAGTARWRGAAASAVSVVVMIDHAPSAVRARRPSR
jgi:hypothetical protein